MTQQHEHGSSTQHRALVSAHDVVRALEYGELSVQYQPIFDIRLGLPVLHQAEAFVRWPHPIHGLLTASDLMADQDTAYLMPRITDYVFHRVAEQLRVWRRRGIKFPVAVNLATDMLGDTQFPDRLSTLLGEFKIETGDLSLELSAMRVFELDDNAVAVLNRLAESGHKVVVDNFGLAPVALEIFAQLPISSLKIDQQLVQRIDTDSRSRQLVRGLIHLGHDLQSEVCALGVENQDTLVLLKGLGCDSAQGWHLGRADSASQLELNMNSLALDNAYNTMTGVPVAFS